VIGFGLSAFGPGGGRPILDGEMPVLRQLTQQPRQRFRKSLRVALLQLAPISAQSARNGAPFGWINIARFDEFGGAGDDRAALARVQGLRGSGRREHTPKKCREEEANPRPGHACHPMYKCLYIGVSWRATTR
jgi:hypothetical protein